jgi:glutaredoxin
MRAFILRRLELIARDLGDVIVIGSGHSAGTLRVKEFLARNGHPFQYIDLDRDREAQELLDRFQISVADVPVLICRGDAVLRNPSNARIADCLGLPSDELASANWPLARTPYLLETSRPRIFAVGDVRGGNIKRVASAVGEGSIAVAFIHHVLRQ